MDVRLRFTFSCVLFCFLFFLLSWHGQNNSWFTGQLVAWFGRLDPGNRKRTGTRQSSTFLTTKHTCLITLSCSHFEYDRKMSVTGSCEKKKQTISLINVFLGSFAHWLRKYIHNLYFFTYFLYSLTWLEFGSSPSPGGMLTLIMTSSSGSHFFVNGFGPPTLEPVGGTHISNRNLHPVNTQERDALCIMYE